MSFIDGNKRHSFNWLKESFSLRVADWFKQKWLSEINDKNSCITYRLFKDDFNIDKYLTVLPGL